MYVCVLEYLACNGEKNNGYISIQGFCKTSGENMKAGIGYRNKKNIKYILM